MFKVSEFLHVLRTRHRLFYHGIPFMVILIGGSFGLKYFAELRYVYRKTRFLTPEEAAEFGVKMKKPEEITPPEVEFEQNKDKVDLDSWQNIRGPRRWEDSKTVQEEQRKQLQAAKSATS